MNENVATEQFPTLIIAIESAGIPALRVAVTIAVVALVSAGLFIFHKRHQLFDRDPNVDGDIPAVRHNRVEEVVLIWAALLLVLLSILYQVWRA
jgi:hypothetical protein